MEQIMQELKSFEPVISFFRKLSSINVYPLTPKPKKNVRKAGQLAPGAFSFEGILRKGQETTYAINGQDVEISEDTWMIGNMAIGAKASVKGVMRNGQRQVTKIVIGKPF